MITSVVALVCHLVAVPAPQGDEVTELVKKCEHVVVIDSERDPTVNLGACLVGQAALAQWLGQHPLYGDGSYWLGGWMCHAGPRGFVPDRET